MIKQGGIAVLAIHLPCNCPLHAALGQWWPPIAKMYVVPGVELADGSIMIKHEQAEQVGQLCLN